MFAYDDLSILLKKNHKTLEAPWKFPLWKFIHKKDITIKITSKFKTRSGNSLLLRRRARREKHNFKYTHPVNKSTKLSNKEIG